MSLISLMQYAKISRTLPKPSKSSQLLKAKEYCDHITRIPKSRPVPHVLAESIRKLAPGLKRNILPLVPQDLMGVSGCAERTRQQGGRQSLLKKFDLTPSFPQGGPVCADWNNRPVQFIDSRVIPVAENGCKTRIVTANEAVRVARGHRVRRTYEPVVNNRKWSSTSDAKVDPELSEIDFSGQTAPDAVVFSGDFTNATGELSHEFLDLLSEELGIDPNDLHRGFSVNGKTVTSGAFQGMPASWVVGLQLGHYFIASYVDRTHSFKIKGDDIIALWTQAQITLYTEIALRVGLVVNHKSVVSRLYGTYCEGDYVLNPRTRVLRRLPTISLRSFVTGKPPGSDAIKTFIQRGYPSNRLVALQNSSMSNIVRLCHEKEVDPYMPEALGGIGLLPPDIYALVPKHYRRVVQGAHNGTLPVIYDDVPGRLDAASSLKKALSSIRQSVNGNPLHTKKVDSEAAHLMGVVAFRNALMGINGGSIETPGRRVRRLRAFVRRCNSQGSDDHETTYNNAYAVLTRLNVTNDSARVFNLLSRQVR
jgi:hypothetical protein